jgi:hypothetical protein
MRSPRAASSTPSRSRRRHFPTELVRHLASGTGRRILFMRTEHQDRKLARQLAESGVPSVNLQGNLSQPARERNLAAFSAGTARAGNALSYNSYAQGGYQRSPTRGFSSLATRAGACRGRRPISGSAGQLAHQCRAARSGIAPPSTGQCASQASPHHQASPPERQRHMSVSTFRNRKGVPWVLSAICRTRPSEIVSSPIQVM